MKKYKLKKSFIRKMMKSYRNVDLAHLLGYKPCTMSNYLSGRQDPSKSLIIKLCFHFNVKPKEILK